MAASAATSMSLEVRYQGYVHTDLKAGTRPGMEQVRLAHSMMARKNLKKTRDIHPLFARGFDTPLQMTMSEKGLLVQLMHEKTKQADAVVMNHQMHKIAFVATIGNTVHIVMKRPGVGKFNDHAFLLETEAKATEVTRMLSQITNDVFRKLRQVTRILETKKRQEVQAPAVPTRTVKKDEEQPWYHGVASRQQAEQLLLGANATNGLFMVRQSERSPTDYALSFCYNKRAYHNKISKTPDGKFVNHKSTVFPSLTAMVHAYQSPHEDMQTIITEYVPNTPVQGTEGAPVYQNVALTDAAGAQAAADLKRWSTTDIQTALNGIEFAPRTPAEEYDDQIAFDPIYDDSRFGFGNEFVSMTLGLLEPLQAPQAEIDLDGELFSCGQLEGEAEC